LKVLVSALACEPGRGSENEVGFQAVRAAASRHDVWVLTLSPIVPLLEGALKGDPVSSRVHVKGMDFGVSGDQFDHLTMMGYQRLYNRWQHRVGALAVQLDREIGFDLVHHVTIASYWTRVGVAVVKKPLVWGPVGGGVSPPLRLMSALGPRGTAEDIARMLIRPLLARTPPVRRARRSAEVIFAQNRATMKKLDTSQRVVLMSNALAVNFDGFPKRGARNSEVLFVGRLVPWKGPLLALRMMRYINHPEAVLRFCGRGREWKRLEKLAHRWKLSDRVRFQDWIPRNQLLVQIARAGTLVHPSLHEEAGLCIAEALSLGTPVVCLDHGGPSELVEHWPDALSERIRPSSPDGTAREMAEAVDRFLYDPPPERDSPVTPTTSFGQRLLEAYEIAAAARHQA
jgi:glycosyltransferase involved in cell wall biosynthesis